MSPLQKYSLFFHLLHDASLYAQVVDFTKWDEENPRNWSRARKLVNLVIVALMARTFWTSWYREIMPGSSNADQKKVTSPLTSSMFTPGLDQIGHDLNVPSDFVIGATTGFVLTLGIGPLILAPLSKTFGRRRLYLVCYSIFTLLQLPTALSPNIQTLLVARTFSGFFGST